MFPGTGSEKEIGVGNIFNAPLIKGTKGKKFLEIFEQKVLVPIDKFKPEIILISAGFDAHVRDPLANINLESNDFYHISHLSKLYFKCINFNSQVRFEKLRRFFYTLLAKIFDIF